MERLLTRLLVCMVCSSRVLHLNKEYQPLSVKVTSTKCDTRSNGPYSVELWDRINEYVRFLNDYLCLIMLQYVVLKSSAFGERHF